MPNRAQRRRAADLLNRPSADQIRLSVFALSLVKSLASLMELNPLRNRAHRVLPPMRELLRVLAD